MLSACGEACFVKWNVIGNALQCHTAGRNVCPDFATMVEQWGSLQRLSMTFSVQVRPLRSLFQPAVFVSMMGQAVASFHVTV
eukprot:2297045-Amphidinium_carterae.1